jgi:hypothetical protein
MSAKKSKIADKLLQLRQSRSIEHRSSFDARAPDTSVDEGRWNTLFARQQVLD